MPTVQRDVVGSQGLVLMSAEEYATAEAIARLTRVLSNAQAFPPAGATFPFEVFVTLRFDGESQTHLREIAESLKDVAAIVRSASK
jgi:hypothetical protein